MRKLAIATIIVLLASSAQAATIQVDGAVCTLSDAIVAANTDTATGGCAKGDPGADTLVLNADVTLTTVDALSTMHNGVGAGLPDVTDDLTITAGTATTIRRDPAYSCDAITVDPVFRFLNLESGSLVLEGLTFENGCFVAADADNDGGGILAAASTELTLDGVSVNGFGAFSTSGNIQGGFLFTEGDRLTVLGGTFDGLVVEAAASLQGGILHMEDTASTTIQGSTFSNLDVSTSSSSLQGGVVFSRADLTIEGSHFMDVTVDAGSSLQGGGIYLSSSDSALLTGSGFARFTVSSVSSMQGGAVYAFNDSFHLSDVTFSELEATSSSTCTGGALYSGSGGNYERWIVEDGLCRSLTSGAEGAAARFTGTAPVLRDCVFRRNEAQAYRTGRGGAVYANDIELIERCAFVDNRVISDPSVDSRDARGGGLRAGRVDLLRNVTFSGNVAQAADGISVGADGGSAEGGGLYLSNGSESSVLASVTFTSNRTVAGKGAPGFLDGEALGGGLFVNLDHTAEIVGSILSGNQVIDTGGVIWADDCASQGTLTSLGYNLVEDPASSCSFNAFGDVTGLDPNLYPVGDYGCSTALPDGSCVPTAAVDQTSWAVDWSSCAEAGVARDARGLDRRVDIVGVLNLTADACDAGAFEAQDTDGDGVTDVPDLCPNDPDPDQSDSDDDQVGDACDACEGDDASGDSDGDWVCDDLDICAGSDDTADADQDSVPDGCDLCTGDDASGDSDSDLVCDDLDICAGSDDTVDADGDGVPDGCDLCTGDDASGDSDGDGLCDDRDTRVGDRVWLDDGNGIQDGGEPGVAAVTVNLYDATDLLVDTTSTDADGHFSFSPGPGDFYLEFVLPTDMAFARRSQGGDDTVDSDPSIVTGTTAVFSLLAGQVDTTRDAGLEPAVIGDRVWLDTNADGRRQPDESGLSGVTVRLLDPSDTEVAITTTDMDGSYAFLGMAGGDYRLEVVLPVDGVFSDQDVGSDDLIDSDVDPATGRSPLFTYEQGSASRRWDAGLRLLPFFADSFESGDLSAWSSTSP